MYKIGYGLTASYCTIDTAIETMEDLVSKGFEVIPIVTKNLIDFDTRFGKGKDLVKKLEEITNNKVVSSFIEAEKFGPKEPLDIVVIAPMTGNSISKFACAHNDNAVLMAAKATLRNNRPVVIGVATNDGLGLSGVNIMKLINSKHIYFVPFSQDNPVRKPKSLVAHFDLVYDTCMNALEGKQIQPVLRQK